LVESDRGDIKGELVEAAGYKFLIAEQVADCVPAMSDITVDFSSEGSQIGFWVYLSD